MLPRLLARKLDPPGSSRRPGRAVGDGKGYPPRRARSLRRSMVDNSTLQAQLGKGLYTLSED